ncbi:unnamed protein product [Strongylus vulgaris]|uniref:Uncharacterized protein n=1 Tax=Strongylus vulgaris TaxID=40348 RepID=A0A3P7JI28_STRVU|nr:unnamed protein product [Strongylus vulgaris]
MKKEHRRWTWESPNGTMRRSFSATEGGAYWTSQCRKLKKKICNRVGGRGEVVHDGGRLEELLTTCDWSIEEDSTKDYDLFLMVLRAYSESALMPTRNLGRISKVTKGLLERRRALSLDPIHHISSDW